MTMTQTERAELIAAIKYLEGATERDGYYRDGSPEQVEVRLDRGIAWGRIMAVLTGGEV